MDATGVTALADRTVDELPLVIPAARAARRGTG
jgi:hypothetical protein